MTKAVPMGVTDQPSTLPPNLTPTAQLLLDLFEGRANALATPFAQWMATSKPFAIFAQKYLSKIRKKVRMSRDAEETYNLYCELRTAYLLLQEPKFAITYEPRGKEQGRSADFAVSFRTNTTFHVEVTRLRVSQPERLFYQQEDALVAADQAEQLASLRRYESRRLVDVVCDKFGQLSPDTPNVLWVWSDSRVMQELEIGEVMAGLKRGMEKGGGGVFWGYGFEKPADFIRYYQRLSAILVQNLSVEGREPVWWQNSDSRHPLAAKVATMLRELVAADSSVAYGVE